MKVRDPLQFANSICINGTRTYEFCSFLKNVAEENTRILYSLYGVVEHSGTMRSGHYTAYAKARTANSHLSNLVLHGDIPHGKMLWEIPVFSMDGKTKK